jgi:pimeloyl-ACP methyl ester carboxylesterase
LKRAYVDTPQGQIHYTAEGEGPPLVLIGSAGRSARVFDGLIQLMSPDFRVLAVDVMGCGNSDPLPPGAGMETFAGNVVSVLDALGIERTHFYGFQTGNKIGAALAARWPDRVDRVVLAGQSHSLVPDKAHRDAVILGNVTHYFGERGGEDAERMKLWATGFRRISDIWWHGSLFSPPQAAGRFERARAATIDRVQALPGAVRTYEANFAYDLGADLRRIAARTLLIEVVTPAEDKTIGRQGQRLLQIMPGAQLAVLEEEDGPSHAVTLEAQYPELAALLRRFLLTEDP